MVIKVKQILLDDQKKEPFYMQIYDYFKNEIIQRNLKKDEKLPSIRELSMDLKVSKTTVESAYNQLVVEGYVNNISKRGYFVVELRDYDFPMEKNTKPSHREKRSIYYKNSGVDKGSFDKNTWRKLYGNILMSQEGDLFTGGDPQGEESLRDSICEFVGRTRGVKCSRQQIVIGAGIQYLLGILCSLLKDNHRSIAMEYPGFTPAKNVFEDYNMDILSIPVFQEGIDIEKLKQSHAKMVYLSPSHQYPTGSVMPIDKRLEILNWAKENDSIIIEDDYDGLIRYETRPIPALQGLDKVGQVIYLGSFSKILLPSIRISYMILPRDILEKYSLQKNRYSQTSSKLEQLALSQFMQQGYLEKHLRKIKKAYARKNERIVDFIKKHAQDKINIIGHDSGLHMMFELKSQKGPEEIIEGAKKANIYLEVIEGYREGQVLLVFPYSGLEEGEIPNILEKLIENVF